VDGFRGMLRGLGRLSVARLGTPCAPGPGAPTWFSRVGQTGRSAGHRWTGSGGCCAAWGVSLLPNLELPAHRGPARLPGSRVCQTGRSAGPRWTGSGGCCAAWGVSLLPGLELPAHRGPARLPGSRVGQTGRSAGHHAGAPDLVARRSPSLQSPISNLKSSMHHVTCAGRRGGWHRRLR